MKNASTPFWALVLIATLGMWCCAQQKNGANTNKIRDLESRYQKLEDDYRHLAQNSESHRKRLAIAENQRVDLQRQVEELKNIAQERDEIEAKLVLRTTERDQVQTQFSQFTRDLQSLVQRMETASKPSTGSLQAVPTSRTKIEE